MAIPDYVEPKATTSPSRSEVKDALGNIDNGLINLETAITDLQDKVSYILGPLEGASPCSEKRSASSGLASDLYTCADRLFDSVTRLQMTTRAIDL